MSTAQEERNPFAEAIAEGAKRDEIRRNAELNNAYWQARRTSWRARQQSERWAR